MAQLRSLLYVAFIIVVVAGWFINRRKNNRRSDNLETNSVPTIMPESDEEALNHAHWKVRLKALETLTKNKNTNILATLLYMLADPVIDIRLKAMAEIVLYGDEAILGLSKILERNNLPARESAIQTLITISSPATVPVLIKALHTDGSAWVRAPAAQGLGVIGGDEACEALISALSDSHPDVISAIHQALQAIGTPKALEAMRI